MSFAIFYVQSDDLSFYESALSRSQISLSEVRGKSGKIRVFPSGGLGDPHELIVPSHNSCVPP